MGRLQSADSGSYTFIERKEEFPKNVAEFKNTNSLSLNIDAPSGIYFLTIKDGNNKTTVRIVKE